EAAVSRADVSEDHEGRGAVAPTLKYVWASSLLTDRVKAQIVDHPGHPVEGFAGMDSNLEPLWSGPRQLRLSHSLPTFRDSYYIPHSVMQSIADFPIADCGLRIADWGNPQSSCLVRNS